MAHLRVQREAERIAWAISCSTASMNSKRLPPRGGGVRQLLDEKWRKVYKANAPHGMFSPSEMHHAG